MAEICSNKKKRIGEQELKKRVYSIKIKKKAFLYLKKCHVTQFELIFSLQVSEQNQQIFELQSRTLSD